LSYNLLDEQWIPTLWTDGKVTRVGIKEALTQAGRIRQIAASNPMDRVAILRFLLALLYWCWGNPSADTDSLSTFPAAWFQKLDENRECFNLLGEGNRFYQDRGARRRRPITDLLQEIPTGNNFWHFRHSTDYHNGLCPACCTMGLLRLPLFSVSSLPDLRAGINGTPPVYVVPSGKTLIETLSANWTPRTSLGTPAWVRPHVDMAADEDVPILTGLTLLPRRVWLHEPRERGVCVACGMTGPVIKACEFQSAGKQENERWADPQVVLDTRTRKRETLEAEGLTAAGKFRRKTLKATDLTAAGKFRMDRPWPDLLKSILLKKTEKAGYLSQANEFTLLVVGFATDQAKSIDVWERTIRLPNQEFNQDIVARMILQWQKEGTSIEKRVVRHKSNSRAAMASVRPHVESEVSTKVEELLSGGNRAWKDAASKYHPMMQAVAKSLAPGFTTTAIRERKKIANTLPRLSDHAPMPRRNQEAGDGEGSEPNTY